MSSIWAREGDDLRFEAAHDDSVDLALGLLLLGKRAESDSDRAAVAEFRGFARENQFSLEGLWLAFGGAEAVASTLVVPSAGRTGMLFLSPILSRDRLSAASGLARHACLAQDSTRVRLVQALLDPGQKQEAKALEMAQFTDLATLLYMQRHVSDTPFQPLVLDERFSVVHWSDAHRSRFAAAILGSYEQTRDCPGLLGLRHIDDIIAGHLATGHFDSTLWYALHAGDEPVGVMLLNKVPQRQALELVYLGLSPAWRGKGLARLLVRHALGLAEKHHATSMILAVDQANAPALSLYQSFRFAETARKHAKIFPLI